MAPPQIARKTEHRSGTPRYRWTRRQYDQMVEAGVLTMDDRVEWINGEIVEMSPHGSRPYLSVHLLADLLRSIYASDWHVRTQAPLALDPDSEPEPDVAVVAGVPRDYRDEHPKTALLVVEVADAALYRDRRLKAALYARHGIKEYWIVNLNGGCIEVHRDPDGGTYATRVTLRPGESLQPPQGSRPIAVTEVLP